MRRPAVFFPLLTAVLFALAFPNFSFGFLAWFALIPLLAKLRNAKTRREAFVSGFISGLFFYLGTLPWLCHVTTFGYFFLAVLEAGFMGLFGAGTYEAFRSGRVWVRVLGCALVWTAAEWLRAEIPVFGFGWNLIAYSQSAYLLILQTASVIGVYGLGFLIVLVNMLLFELLQSLKRESGEERGKVLARMKRTASLGASLALLGMAVMGYGAYRLEQKNSGAGILRVAVIQGNIPQSIKWEPLAKSKIIEKYLKLTEIVHFDAPDLILWPEAAFPGYLNRDYAQADVRALVRKIDTPVLIGSPYYDGGGRAFNSAMLIGPDGNPKGRYDKLYLVPFGEYVPLKPLLGFLEPLARSLGVSDFSPGKDRTLFRLENGDLPFSVLICFEDIFPALSRAFVKKGARFLAVITNDAWFQKTPAPRQHLQASIFRAVETGVPIVRAANTGVSAFISRKGRVLATVRDERGEELFVTGHMTYPLPIDTKPTGYLAGGWGFPYAASAFYIILMISLGVKRRRNH